MKPLSELPEGTYGLVLIHGDKYAAIAIDPADLTPELLARSLKPLRYALEHP